jgi:hypothetical protein
MRRRLLPLLLALPLCAPVFAGAEEEAERPAATEHGAGVTLTEVTRLAEVSAEPERFRGRPVLVRGRVRDVCQKKGCWMVVDDGSAQARVRFADYAFFVPKDSSGKEAWVQGEVSVKTLSRREARHYAGESTREDPSEVDGPRREIGITATGVRLVDPPESP